MDMISGVWELLFFMDIVGVVVSFVFLYISRVRLFVLNPITLFFYLYLLTVVLAQFFIILSQSFLKNSLISELVVIDSNFEKINFLVISFLLLFSLGIFLSRITMDLSRKLLKTKSLTEYTPQKLVLLYLSFLLILLLLVISIFFLKFGFFILAENPDYARYFALERGAWKYLLIAYVYINIPLGGISLFFFLKKKKKIFLIFFLLSILIQLTSLISVFRSFVILYILVMSSVYFSLRNVSKRKMLILLLSALLFIIVGTILRYKEIVMSNPDILFYKLLHRTIFESSYSLRIIFYIFDTTNYPFLLGSSYIWDLISKLPGEQPTFQNFLAEMWGGTQWHIALIPTLPGELYANFGWFSIFMAFLFGYVLGIFSFYLEKKICQNNNFRFILGYIILSIFSIRSVTVGFGGVYFSVVAIMLLFLPLFLLQNFLRRIYENIHSNS